MLWVQTFLIKLQAWQWIGIFVTRLAVGLLFFLSGRGKLFVLSAGNRCARRCWRRTFLFQVQCALCLDRRVCLRRVSSTWLCDGTRLRDDRGHFNYRDQKYQGNAATRLAIGVFVPSRGPLSVILFWLFLSGAGWFSVDHLLVSDARL
jgi:hypothetical protein